MNQETIKTLIAIRDLLEILIPVAATIASYLKLSKESKKHAAKQSILQMIMEDQFNWELFRKFPVNYANIHNEYKIYHKCGGNGEVTKKVKEYRIWYEENESLMMEMKNYSCGVEITTKCRKNRACSLPKSRTKKKATRKEAK